MIINVIFKNKKSGAFYGNTYSYRCSIEDVQVGDIVIAPTANGDGEVKVVAVDVPESKVDERILPRLKTITKRKED